VTREEELHREIETLRAEMRWMERKIKNRDQRIEMWKFAYEQEKKRVSELLAQEPF
jgi:hypothetical protein